MWSFVGKKEKHTDPDDPADDLRGDCWDHVAFDPESRLVVAPVVGRRTAEHAELLVGEFAQRTGKRLMNLMTSAEYAPYAEAIRNTYGTKVLPPRTGKPGRPRGADTAVPDELQYATVHKTRRKGRVVSVSRRAVYGTDAGVAQALASSSVSERVNTSFVERFHGTNRHRNARKRRKTYCFSKDRSVHEAMTYFTVYSYNFCWAVRTLRVKAEGGRWQQRTPAMAAGLADHVWSLAEWLRRPAVRRKCQTSEGH